MGKNSSSELAPDTIYEKMEVLEPYTTGELASYFDAPKQRVRDLLERLVESGKVRKKEPESKRAIWIRKAPVHSCSDCGYRYEIKFVHPIFSAVQFCPRCGNQI